MYFYVWLMLSAALGASSRPLLDTTRKNSILVLESISSLKIGGLEIVRDEPTTPYVYFPSTEDNDDEVKLKREEPSPYVYFPESEEDNSDAEVKRDEPTPYVYFPSSEDGEDDDTKAKRDGESPYVYFPETEETGEDSE